ncbi:MAG: hypothetical protein Q7S65_00470 [Nanoarchaeota archaeon]|nr:hypothetical protein [Nanoarchaeota archaeon]
MELVKAVQVGMLVVSRAVPGGEPNTLQTGELQRMRARDLSDCAVTVLGEPVDLVLGTRRADYVCAGLYGNTHMKPGTPAANFLQTMVDGVEAALHAKPVRTYYRQ